MTSKGRFDVEYLLSCNMEDLASAIASMSADDCEKYARAILTHVDGPSFETYLSRILRTMIPDDGSPPPASSDGYYLSVRDMFPHVPGASDALGRLCALVMQMCILRTGAGQHVS
jgi:hypothetical protein